MALFAGSKNYLGIDLGTDAIKVLEVQKKGEAIYLTNYAELKAKEELTPTPSRETFLNTQDEFLAKLILEVLNKGGFRARRCSISIPVHSTFTTIIEVPLLEKKELEQAIKYEAQKHIPVSLSEMIIEWKIIEEFLDKSTNTRKVRVFIMAVPRELVEKYRNFTKKINLLTDFLEVEIFSIRRSANISETEKFLLIDMGGLNTNITLFEGEIVKKTVNLPFGGFDFTRMIENGLKIKREEAESIKKEKGINDPRIKNILYSILNNIRLKSEEFTRQEKNLKKIILAGGGVLMPGFKEFLEQEFKGMSVEILNPWKKLVYNKNLESIIFKKGAIYSVVIGLALKINEINY